MIKCLGISALDSFWGHKLFAILGVASITAINAFSTKLGARTGNVFFILKLVLLLGLIILGIVGSVLLHNKEGVEQSALINSGGNLFKGSSDNVGNYAIALYAGLWAYDGWDNVNYVSAEMKNARKDLPRVIHIALPVVIVAYLLANISYYSVLSKDELINSNTVTLTMARKVMGTSGGVIFALLIAFSCLGALNASVFTFARLIYTSSKDGFFPSIFARTHLKRGTPINSLIFSAVLTTVFILAGDFQSLLTFYGFAGYLFYFLTVLGLIVLRIKEPTLDRPYKTFIATPILFCCVALFLISRTIFEKPLESLYALLFMLLGVPIYMWRFGISWKPSIPSKIKKLFGKK